MPGWTARHADALEALPFSALRALEAHPPGAATIRTALFFLTVAAFFVTWFSARRGRQSLWAYLMFGGIVAMLANVFVPHVPATIVFQSYTPGVATAVLVNLPVMSWLALRAVRDEWVSGSRAVAFGVGVPIALAALIAVLLRS